MLQLLQLFVAVDVLVLRHTMGPRRWCLYVSVVVCNVPLASDVARAVSRGRHSIDAPLGTADGARMKHCVFR